MTYFSRNNRVGKKVRKNLSFLLVFLIFALLTISVGNIKSINDVEAIDNQSQILSAESDFIWDQTWGGNETDMGSAIWSDGTYFYTSGTTGSFGEGERDVLLIKWDAEGNQIWNRTWGGIDYDTSQSIWGDGTHLYTSGSTLSFGVGDRDLLIIKWDTDGNQIWNRTWGGINYDQSQSIWGNGTYLYITGYTESFGEGGTDVLIVKWDTDGNQIWNRTWGGVDNDFGLNIKEKDDYIYTSGYTECFGEGRNNLLIIKWDAEGNQIWNRTWGGIDYDQLSTSLWCDESYFYTAGLVGNISEDEMEILLIKWDYEGDRIWDRTYNMGAITYINSIWSDGTFLYGTGATYNMANDETQLIFLVWDTEGNIIIEQSWSNYPYSIGNSIWGDDSYIYICGSMDYLEGDLNELLLIKTNQFFLSMPVLSNISPDPDLDGNITINWNDVVGATSYNVYRDSSIINDLTDLVPIGNSTSTPYNDYGLSNGTYYYVIVATRGSLFSPISNCESVQVEISPEPDDTKNKIPGYPLELTITIIGIFIAGLSFRKYRNLV